MTSQDDDAFAEECLSLWIGKTLQGGLIAVICAQNLGGRREINLVLGIRTEIAILIYYIYFYEGCRDRWGLQIPRERGRTFLTADCKSAGTPDGVGVHDCKSPGTPDGVWTADARVF